MPSGICRAVHKKEVFEMPGFDGTGPMGAGPMTGGARGYCNPAGGVYRPAFGQGFWYGRGFGRGRGFGAGFGAGYGRGRGYGRGFGYGLPYPVRGGWYGTAYSNPYPYPMEPSEEINMLRAEADAMKSGLDEIRRRIEELEKESAE
jgi:hypothetical protein